MIVQPDALYVLGMIGPKGEKCPGVIANAVHAAGSTPARLKEEYLNRGRQEPARRASPRKAPADPATGTPPVGLNKIWRSVNAESFRQSSATRLAATLVVALASALVAGCDEIVASSGPNDQDEQGPVAGPPNEPELIEGLLALVPAVILPSTITADDPSALIVAEGPDRIEQGWYWDIRTQFRVYTATYQGGGTYQGDTLEIWVQDSVDRATAHADYFADLVGRLPEMLRRDVDRLFVAWYPVGDTPPPYRDVPGINVHWYLDHHGPIPDPIHEEVMIYNAAAAVLKALARSEEWIAAQKADGRAVSNRAAKFLGWVDLADTMVAYVAVRHRRNRIGEPNARAIEEAIPNRLKVLDSQDWASEWCPIVLEDCPPPPL